MQADATDIQIQNAEKRMNLPVVAIPEGRKGEPAPVNMPGWRSQWRLVLLNSLTCGLEICVAAGITYVPPLLLEAGVEERYMTMVLDFVGEGLYEGVPSAYQEVCPGRDMREGIHCMEQSGLFLQCATSTFFSLAMSHTPHWTLTAAVLPGLSAGIVSAYPLPSNEQMQLLLEGNDGDPLLPHIYAEISGKPGLNWE
ncbi:solute carrier family 45 member 3 isoform X1 [Lates japonicus]|uniref:Solute carrier family 45 member 3 isoform X1 n=1 Tax=Lates japonicus TaxID=270547 RepID=A0AAD3NL79_LATJO|nr:solute carrier family 45 member 3 isoform X1 [Lates japonicus]